MKRFFALLLSLTMIFELLPGTVLAETLNTVSDSSGFKKVESNVIEGSDVEEVFEISFVDDEDADQLPPGQVKKLLSTNTNGKGKGLEKQQEKAAENLRKKGEKLGKLPSSSKKHFYGWVDKNSKKYVNEEMTKGRSVAQVLEGEHRRQSYIEADPEVLRVVRFGFSDVMNDRGFLNLLLDCGVPRTFASDMRVQLAGGVLRCR